MSANYRIMSAIIECVAKYGIMGTTTKCLAKVEYENETKNFK